MPGNGSGGANAIYSTHLFGAEARYQPNTSISRERVIFNEHVRHFSELAVNRFQWTGLPDSVDPRFLEMSLFYTALAIYYKDKDFNKVFAVRGSGAGFINMLDNPVSFTVISPGTVKIKDETGVSTATSFGNKTIKAYDPTRHDETAGWSNERIQNELCIPIWANAMRSPDIQTVQIYAQRLAWLDRTLEINTKNARRNKVLKTTPAAQLSATNVARQIDQGDELIQVTGPMQDMQFIEALDLGINPDSYDKLSIYRTRVWNEAMGLFGIDNANQDKKERLVAAEVGANDSQTDAFRHISLNARQIACEQINRIFGSNVQVDFRTEIEQKNAVEEAQNQADENEADAGKKEAE